MLRKAPFGSCGWASHRWTKKARHGGEANHGGSPCIENRQGTRLRYREPTWSKLLGLPGGFPKKSGGAQWYTGADVTAWRAKHRLPKGQHSLGVVSYTDEELLEWRFHFDKHARSKDELISITEFERLLAEKYRSKTTPANSSPPQEKQMPQEKVMDVWARFDKHQRNAVDFGDFLKAGFLFDLEQAKEQIKEQGPSEVFAKYAGEEGVIGEDTVHKLMEDFGFSVVTPTDVRKVLRMADKNKDGLLSEEEFRFWLDTPTPRRHRSLDLPGDHLQLAR